MEKLDKDRHHLLFRVKYLYQVKPTRKRQSDDRALYPRKNKKVDGLCGKVHFVKNFTEGGHPPF